MNFCTAAIRIAGDLRNVVHRNTFSPVSWPEIEILRQLHGNDAVIDVTVFAKVNQTPKAEKERLRAIYGSAVVEDVFPGKNPQMEMEAPGARLPENTPAWRNPIDLDPFAPPSIETKQSTKARTPVGAN